MTIRSAAPLLCLLALPLLAQAPSKIPVPYSAYDGWNALRGTTLSRNGSWLVYALVPEDGDGTLVARNLKTGVEHRAPRGEDPVISADGRWVVFTVVPTRAARDAARKKARGKPDPEHAPKNGMGIMDLSTGAVTTVDRVRRFALAENASRFVAYRLEPAPSAKPAAPEAANRGPWPRKKKDPGSDLIVRDLASGQSATFPRVTDFAWTKDGARLAFASATSGVSVWTAASGLTSAPVTALAGAADSAQLAWNDAGSDLGFVSDIGAAQSNPPRYALYLAPSGRTASRASDAALPPGMQPSPNGKLEFSADGRRLFFGIAPPPPPTPKTDPDMTQVDLWSWTDAELQPMQKVRAEAEADASYPAEAFLDATGAATGVVPLASPELPAVLFSANHERAALASDVPYQIEASWDGGGQDYYALNLADGSRRLVLKDSHFPATLSPGGDFLLYFAAADHNWHAIRLSDGHDVNLTAALGVAFQNELWDQPSPAAPYGDAGWTADDARVLLYDRYDIWSVRPDGSGAINLTAGLGRRRHLVFRYLKLDPEAKIIPAGPLVLSATNDLTKASGFYQLADSNQSAAPRELLMRDEMLGGVVKAKSASTLVYTRQSFSEFPDLWASNTGFADSRKVSDANPQQVRYRWGTSRLIHYINRDGKPLDAVLITPDGFDPHRQYPLIVYIYERLTNNLHRYLPPAPGTNINLARFVSHGYVVLEPDIAYNVGYPGDSALKCVIPAIETVQAMGFIDPHRIGIQGHSWGGYQVAYMVTRTNKFRAVEAGAVVANMTSAYGGIRWGSGMSREFQYEHTQSRIGGPPWKDALLYLENSPLFWVENVQTPYLTIHNDADDAVPWYQGIEFFTALRRLRKPAWMFVFNGEKHGLRQRDNQKYWTVQLDAYFDYFLNGGPEPLWMRHGVPYLQRGLPSVEPLFASPR